MIRIGDRVYHFLDMKNIGTVVNITYDNVNLHLQGGTSQRRIILTVRLDDNTIKNFYREDILKYE